MNNYMKIIRSATGSQIFCFLYYYPRLCELKSTAKLVRSLVLNKKLVWSSSPVGISKLVSNHGGLVVGLANASLTATNLRLC